MQIGRCVTHAKEHLDRLQHAKLINSDSVCEAAEWHRKLFPCGGTIQVNHKIEREYLLVRWRMDNVLAGCGALNLWAKQHKHEWRRMLIDWEGPEHYDELEQEAVSGKKPDYLAALKGLAEAA